MWTHNKESQSKMTPQQALAYLKEGNARFVSNLQIDRNLLKQVNQTSEGQFPFATILSCMDSRTSAELIFDQGLGDIFSIRIAGNILNDDILGSMEYGCAIANSKILVVLGHTKCGAIIGACNNEKLGHLTGLLDKINPAVANERTVVDNRNGNNPEFIRKVAVINVHNTIEQIRNRSEILREMERNNKILIVGGLYDIDSGAVSFFE